MKLGCKDIQPDVSTSLGGWDTTAEGILKEGSLPECIFKIPANINAKHQTNQVNLTY